ncbi:MAG: LysE/ArgO family amino acid transporter [Rhizobiaceae bacterium]|nr:LysE/ArgO family amino acid transporter [Rhizobiaceae bacterium]
MDSNLSIFLAGFLLGGSLIVAIGAQNAFILRQGLLDRHVFVLCLICALSDAVLIAAGVGGLGAIVASSPGAVRIVSVAGAVFLAAYSLLAFRRALRPGALEAATRGETALWPAILACLAFTFLNPHVYLDTVLLVGGLSGQYSGTGRLVFALGAMAASFVWFFGLGYGARLLQPIFARPRSWQVLDVLIGLVMAGLALSLALSV